MEDAMLMFNLRKFFFVFSVLFFLNSTSPAQRIWANQEILPSTKIVSNTTSDQFPSVVTSNLKPQEEIERLIDLLSIIDLCKESERLERFHLDGGNRRVRSLLSAKINKKNKK